MSHPIHNMRETSLEAYEWLKNHGRIAEKEAIVFAKIWEQTAADDPLTDFELAKELGKYPNEVRPRRHYLMQDGLIVALPKRKDRYTDRNAHPWMLNPDVFDWVVDDE